MNRLSKQFLSRSAFTVNENGIVGKCRFLGCCDTLVHNLGMADDVTEMVLGENSFFADFSVQLVFRFADFLLIPKRNDVSEFIVVAAQINAIHQIVGLAGGEKKVFSFLPLKIRELGIVEHAVGSLVLKENAALGIKSKNRKAGFGDQFIHDQAFYVTLQVVVVGIHAGLHHLLQIVDQIGGDFLTSQLQNVGEPDQRIEADFAIADIQNVFDLRRNQLNLIRCDSIGNSFIGSGKIIFRIKRNQIEMEYPKLIEHVKCFHGGHF